MFDEENKDNRTAYILFLTAMIAALSIILWAGNRQFDAQAEKLVNGSPPVNFSSGWTLILSGEDRGIISMPFKVDAAPSEVIELKNTLPKSEDIPYSICFHTMFSTVEVSSGSTLLYRYDSSGTRPFGKAAPSHWNLVRIPIEYTGQEVTLKISSPYRSASGMLSPIWIGDSLQLSSYLLHKYIPQFMICGVFFYHRPGNYHQFCFSEKNAYEYLYGKVPWDIYRAFLHMDDERGGISGYHLEQWIFVVFDTLYYGYAQPGCIPGLSSAPVP
ncbi:hypothetical protein [Clostridium sp. AM58-1XD]|uniref:hypothetical protein n=1 Tax=Clostridium sp. AM58-1XD TaxID=2292307 RepID=UPI0015F5A21C|nr:hypothetical protein [Clostridium sp. AM58-1XD]